MISSEREQELFALYSAIKDSVLDISNKYSTSYHKIEMNFPESLGLPKRTYSAPTDGQLQEVAELAVAAKYLEKKRNAERAYNASKSSLEQKLGVLAENHREKLVQLAKEYEVSVNGLMRKLVDNGLLFSSVKDQTAEDALSQYSESVSEQNRRYSAESAVLTQKESALTSAFEANLTALEDQRLAQIAAVVSDLKEKEEKKKQEVEKYNATVDEKETKYQASCKRYQQYAQQAENERALAAARLYAELGESGVELQKKSEMINFCKSEFWSLTKEEAFFILSIDNFLQTQLGDYYTAFTDWVEHTLT